MKKDSNGYFVSIDKLFKMIKRISIIYLFFLAIIAYFFPAPLGPPANFNTTNTTLKATWFLVWIQELISYSIDCIYILFILVILFFLLPYFSRVKHVEYAMWFPRNTRYIQFMASTLLFSIIALWIIGMFFRGENWQLRF